jgi:hypothetical protein
MEGRSFFLSFFLDFHSRELVRSVCKNALREQYIGLEYLACVKRVKLQSLVDS